MNDRLPELLDRRTLYEELFGVIPDGQRATRQKAAVERIFRACPVVVLPDLRKTYVKRSDVQAYLDRNTYQSDDVR